MPDPPGVRGGAASLSEELGPALRARRHPADARSHGAMGLAIGDGARPRRRGRLHQSPPWFFYEALILGANATPVACYADRDDVRPGSRRDRRRAVRRERGGPDQHAEQPDRPDLPGRDARAARSAAGAALASRPARLSSCPTRRTAGSCSTGTRCPTPVAHHYDRSLLSHVRKSALAPAQRLGYLAMPPSHAGARGVREAAFGRGVLLGDMAPDAVMQYALPDLLDITVDMGSLQRRRDVLLGALRGAGYDVHRPRATFYLLVRSPIPDEVAFVRAACERQGASVARRDVRDARVLPDVAHGERRHGRARDPLVRQSDRRGGNVSRERSR